MSVSMNNASILSATENDPESIVTVDDADILSSEIKEDFTNLSQQDISHSVLIHLDAHLFDDPLLYPTVTDGSMIKFSSVTTSHGETKSILNSATVVALIVELTSPNSIDYQFLLDFFLTYRTFLTTRTLAEILMTRFLWAFRLTVGLHGIDPMKKETGKLVLIRTFVTLRHWLLNYFQDDFINNNNLKTRFVNFINELSEEVVKNRQEAPGASNLDTEIGVRVLIELKKVYINLCSIYWSTIPLEHITPDELLLYPLNAYEHMNNSKLSAMGLAQAYDPSFRRSGILSLYNSKSDSATNLLLQKHNENKAKSLANFLYQNNKQVQKPFKIFTENETHFLHPKDSLVSLNKAYAANKNANPKTPLKPTLTNIIQDEVKYTPLEGVKRLSKNELGDEAPQLGKRGFTTNGDIGLFTDSKIHKIVPTTPSKRPRHIRDHRPAANVVSNSQMRNIGVKSQTTKKQSEQRGGFGKLVTSWRKRFQSHKMEHKELSPLIDNVSKIIRPASEVPQLRQSSSQSTLTDNKAEVSDVPSIHTRVDILSARIIEEFQYLLNDQKFKSNLSRQLLHEPRRRQSVFSLATAMRQTDETDVQDDTFSASPTKKFNRDAAVLLEGAGDTDIISFKAPSVSFNWTDSFNDVSNANSSQVVNDVVPSMINELQINDEDHDDEIEKEDWENTPKNNHESSKFEQLSAPPVEEMFMKDEPTPVDKENFSQGHAPSRDRKSMHSARSYISYDSQLSKDLGRGDELDNSRFSVRRVPENDTFDDNMSLKSYVSYDSALSAKVENDIDGIESQEAMLKKKLSFQDLKLASPKRESFHSVEVQATTHMSISLEKEDYGNLVSMKELPYCISSISGSTTEIIKRDSSSFFNLIKKYRLSLRSDMGNDENVTKATRVNDLSIHSIDDDSSEDEISIADYESTISHLDGQRNNDEQYLFDSDDDDGSRVSMIPSIHSSMIMPFPGLDSAAIAELAAIPDDSVNDDPVAAALLKLEGRYVRITKEEMGKVYYGLNDEDSQYEDPASQSSIDEVKLEDKVRDLFITNKPVDAPEPQTTEAQRNSHFSVNSSREICASTPYKLENASANDPQPLNQETPIPALEAIMDTCAHISFILSYDSEPLAKQLTVIEKDALLEVDWKELIELRWQQTVEPINSWLELLLDEKRRRGINLVISRFNLMINWTVSEILLTANLNERKTIITRFIHIAQHCKKLQNYSTLMQIVLALTSARVSKLTKTWDQISEADIMTLQNLEKLASPFKNFANLRNDIKGIIPSKGCIPFLGLYLSDLTFNAERPNFFKRNDPNDTMTSIDRSLIDEFSDSSKLINFAKFRTSASVVRSLIQSIEWSKLYTIQVDNEIVSKCLYIKSLTDEEMNICVQKIGE